MKQNTAISKHFGKTHGVYSYKQCNYFQRGCMDKWRSGEFSIQTWCIPLEAFASRKRNKIQLHTVDRFVSR